LAPGDISKLAQLAGSTDIFYLDLELGKKVVVRYYRSHNTKANWKIKKAGWMRGSSNRLFIVQ
jgi:hypothetical protein